MPRCGDCNKFVSLNEEEPEVNNLEITEEGAVTVEVRIVNACADCGTELREATFELEVDLSEAVQGHAGEGHELEVTETSAERTTRETGAGRGRRTFYGVKVEVDVACSCGGLEASGVLEDDIQASAMDEC